MKESGLPRRLRGFIAMLKHQSKETTALRLSGFEVNEVATSGFRAALANVAEKLQKILEDETLAQIEKEKS